MGQGRATQPVRCVLRPRLPEIAINNAGTAPMDVLVDEVTGFLFFAPGGPGYEGARIHAPEEHIQLSDLIDATRVTACLLMQFGGRK